MSRWCEVQNNIYSCVCASACRFSPPLKGNYSEEEEKDHLKSRGDSINAIVPDTGEYFPRPQDGVNDGAKSRVCEYDVRRCPCRVSRPLHGNSNVSALESRGVVHAVSGHSAREPAVHQHLHNFKFVFGVHFCEAVCVFDDCRESPVEMKEGCVVWVSALKI